MEKIRFNDKAFRDHIGAWVQTVDDEDLSRAWDIVVGCLAVRWLTCLGNRFKV